MQMERGSASRNISGTGFSWAVFIQVIEGVLFKLRVRDPRSISTIALVAWLSVLIRVHLWLNFNLYENEI